MDLRTVCRGREHDLQWLPGTTLQGPFIALLQSLKARHFRTTTTRNPIWSDRRSGSNRARKADLQGQPSSVQAPPRRAREELPSRFTDAELLAEYRSGSTPPGN